MEDMFMSEFIKAIATIATIIVIVAIVVMSLIGVINYFSYQEKELYMSKGYIWIDYAPGHWEYPSANRKN